MVKRQRFTAEFKREAVRLLDAGERPASELAIDLDIRRNQLYKWKAERARSGEASFQGSGRKVDQDSEIGRLKRELARVTEERDILKSGGVLRQEAAMKYDFMRRRTDPFSLTGMCRALSASRSGYYAWRDREAGAHQRDDVALAAHVRRIYAASREAYGARKVKALVAEGIACGRHRLARGRREHGIEARRRRRFKVTHYARRHKRTALDLVRRQFQAERPNQCWAGDVTFISTRAGWLYLAVLIDWCSRKVVGWALSDRNDEPLVSAALRMAIPHRRLNACAESLFSTLKNELTHGQAFATREAARMAVVSHIDSFYHRKRLHQTLGYRTPASVDDDAMSA